MKLRDIAPALVAVAAVGAFVILLAEPESPQPVVDRSFRILDSDGNLLVSERDIDWYDWSTHEIHLHEDRREPVRHRVNSPEGPDFVVLAEGEECYRGTFLSIVMSNTPPNPFILCLEPADWRKGKPYTVQIGGGWRGDNRLRDGRVHARLTGIGKLFETEQ